MIESREAWIAKKAEALKSMTLVQGSAHLIAAMSQYESEFGEPRPPDLCTRIIIAAYGDQPEPVFTPSGEIIIKR